MDWSMVSAMSTEAWARISTMPTEGGTGIVAISTVFMALVILITARVAWLQLKEISKSRKADTFMNIAQFVQQVHIRKARDTLIKTSRSEKRVDEWSDEEKEAAELACSVYDIAGALVSKGLIEEDFFVNRWAHSIIRCWKAAEPIIKEYRKIRRGDYWKDFEKIYKMAKSTPYADKVEEGKMSYPNEDPRAAWLWGYLMHYDTVLNSRTNFFLVAESMLMVSYVAATNATPPRIAIMVAIAILALIFTGTWLYVNGRTAICINKLVKEVDKAIAEYKEIRDGYPGLGPSKLLGYLLPSVTLAAWVALIILLRN